MKRGVVITELNGVSVNSLTDFEARWAALPNGSKATLRYFALGRPNLELLAVATVDRLWFPMRRCVRDDATGSWPCVTSPDPPPAADISPAATTFNGETARPMLGRRPGRHAQTCGLTK